VALRPVFGEGASQGQRRDKGSSGKDVTLTHSLGWIDYKPGDVPSDLIRRAEQVLHLHGKASCTTSP
jgi:hypothetical protein